VIAFLAALLSLAAVRVPAQAAGKVEAVVLGIAQDGGVPHAGCRQKLCAEARSDPSRRRRVASLGLIDAGAGRRFMIDATPDFAEQMETLGGIPDGILLTHAHIGHYLGLAQLGREVLGTRGVPVYCTPSMARFLRENRPWSRLLLLGNVVLREIEPGQEVQLSPGLRVEAVRVPHRDEDSDTVAYFIRGPSRRLLWLPDIDKWEKWDRSIAGILSEPSLIVFLDGTFFDAAEIPGRTIAEIPHPLVPETVKLAGTPRAKTYFVHLNHTNRLLWETGTVRTLAGKGYGVAAEGQRHTLSE
jgi:pyrroloquinoline quinone biosynthesis protein B